MSDSLAGMAATFEGAMREGARPVAVPAQSAMGEATREQCIGCRLAFTWLGQSRAVYGANLRAAAEVFGAESSALRLSKKLLDARHPAVRALTTLRGDARERWVLRTLPFPEVGVRLLRRDRVDELAGECAGFASQIRDAAMRLQLERTSLLEEAERRLGSLFSMADYPVNFANAFGLSVSFPNVEPPDYLMALNPELYQREQERVRATFEAAVAIAQSEFTEELAQLVGHLRTRLTGEGADGRPHIFRDSAIGNIREFIARVRYVSVETDGALASLLTDAEGLLSGVSPGALRQDEGLRTRVAADLAGLEEQITVALPARRIHRLAPTEEGIES